MIWNPAVTEKQGQGCRAAWVRTLLLREALGHVGLDGAEVPEIALVTHEHDHLWGTRMWHSSEPHMSAVCCTRAAHQDDMYLAEKSQHAPLTLPGPQGEQGTVTDWWLELQQKQAFPMLHSLYAQERTMLLSAWSRSSLSQRSTFSKVADTVRQRKRGTSSGD